jgi:hypothetical protein
VIQKRGPKEEEEMAPFDYLICVSFISLLARPIMAKKKSDGQLNLSGTSPPHHIDPIHPLPLFCVRC